MRQPDARLPSWIASRGSILGVALAFALATSWSEAQARPATPASAAALVQRARQLGIARSLAWRRLLHYRTTFGGGEQSEIDNERFFLAKAGAREPEAELEATLLAFLSPVVLGREDAHASCRFPARHRLLAARLGLDDALPRPSCPALTNFLTELDPRAVSLVYVANFLENPASAFGHTFLRIEKRPQPGDVTSALDDERDQGVEYVANVDTANPILYAFKGLTGLFEGVYSFAPYDAKLGFYANVEARDVWEYELALTDAEVRLLALHLWELSIAKLSYYYLTKNCSYHALATIEAAAPRVNLIERLPFVVIPRDTIKALFSADRLVRDVVYRPSRRSQARMAVAAQPPTAPADKAPHLGHGSMRVTLGSGVTSQYGSAFHTVGYRLALHDLTDPPAGEAELSQLQFLDTRLRYDLGERALTLDRLTFAELLALTPLRSYELELSWRGRAFGVRLHDDACRDCFAHGMGVAIGATVATHDERVALFLMGDAHFAISSDLDGVDGSFVRLGAGPYAGVRVRPFGATVALVTASYAFLPWQSLRSTYDVRATLKSGIGKDVALGFEGAAQPRSRELVFGAYLYF